MKAQWNIDKPKDILNYPELVEIAEKWVEVPDIEKMLAYMVFRYQKGSKHMENVVVFSEKKARAQRLSGFELPEIYEEVTGEDGVKELRQTPEFITYTSVFNDFLPNLFPLKWRAYIAVEESLNGTLGVAMESYPKNSDLEDVLKMAELKRKVNTGISEALSLLEQLEKEMADDDVVAIQSIRSKHVARKSRDATGSVK